MSFNPYLPILTNVLYSVFFPSEVMSLIQNSYLPAYGWKGNNPNAVLSEVCDWLL